MSPLLQYGIPSINLLNYEPGCMVKSFIIYRQAVAEQQLIITVSSLMSHLPTPADIDCCWRQAPEVNTGESKLS